MAHLVKNTRATQETTCHAGDARTWDQSLGQEDPLEEGLTTHSSVLAWTIPMGRGAWQATVRGVTKSWARLKQHSPQAHLGLIKWT